MEFFIPLSTHLKEKNLDPIMCIFFFFGPEKLISGQEDMKIKKNALPTLVLEFFCQSKSSCYILEIQKKSKNQLLLLHSFKKRSNQYDFACMKILIF
jgi:hypothetical protein